MNRCWIVLLTAGFAGLLQIVAPAAEPQLDLKPGDRVVLVGGTLTERMQQFGHFEALLYSRFPKHDLVVRNLGWSADEINLRPRSKDFRDHGHTLADHKPNVVLAFWGANESFAGPEGIAKFEAEVAGFLAAPQLIDNYSTARSNWDRTPDTKIDQGKIESLRTIVLVSPIAHENVGRPGLPDGEAHNANLKLYTEALARVAEKHKVPFVDLFTPTRAIMQQTKEKLTINGIHQNEFGDKVVAGLLDAALFGPRAENVSSTSTDLLRGAINEKNLQFWYDYRAVNGFYIYGGRKAPFGVVNFPDEFKKLRKMIDVRDQRIWEIAQGKTPPAEIDDSGTGENPVIPTNFKNLITVSPPEEAAKKFTLAPGYEINLFASEVEFPELENPVAFAFDAKGRLWVCTMPSYPQYLPGTPVNDKVLILEDTNGDGKADKRTVFADKLYLPAGIEFWNGGVIVAQQPNVVFLKDTNGDDKADTRETILHGFDSADSHHAISAFTFDPGGALYFEEGTFHHTQVETPYGPKRCVNAGVFRYEPRTEKFDVFVSYSFANPWGHIFDRWGQNFVADASGGDNYFAAAFSGDVDYPHKHGNLKRFLTKQWRPTCGCELVSSRQFPDEAQGNYLLNNCIGFQGTLQYKLQDDGSGFKADPVDPLVQSSDPNFRPVDIEFAPDGTLYLCDWFNPLVGHMQHSIRDPNRDKKHGRIWRVRYASRPLVKPPQIAGQSIPALVDLLKTQPEERTRYRVRNELWNRPTSDVVGAAGKWLAAQDQADPEIEHHKLETLWLHQAHDAINEPLLKEVLRSPDFRARAAATRVLCYWRDRVEKPLDLLTVQVNDEHPRVRLEAVRALSFFHTQAAIDVAVQSLIHPQDDYLTYTLTETMNTLERRVKK
ncbi:MAG: HEAT repeat domain-containing protein [Pirellulaceae bacterium]|nr:HEAT repeat domain-containing protein [Pirellulaceae bacterium]